MSNQFITKLITPVANGENIVPPPAFCGVNLNFVSALGSPNVTLIPPTTLLDVNNSGALSVGAYYQNATYQTTTDTVHMEQYLDAEAVPDSNNGLGLAFATDPTGAQPSNIAGYNLRPNSTAGAGMGLLLDAVSGGPALTNMTIPTDGSYACALDLDHSSKTANFKDNQGQTSPMATLASSWELNPVYIGSGLVSTTLGASIESTWNPGTQVDQLPTVGSVRPCEAT